MKTDDRQEVKGKGRKHPHHIASVNHKHGYIQVFNSQYCPDSHQTFHRPPPCSHQCYVQNKLTLMRWLRPLILLQCASCGPRAWGCWYQLCHQSYCTWISLWNDRNSCRQEERLSCCFSRWSQQTRYSDFHVPCSMMKNANKVDEDRPTDRPTDADLWKVTVSHRVFHHQGEKQYRLLDGIFLDVSPLSGLDFFIVFVMGWCQ